MKMFTIKCVKNMTMVACPMVLWTTMVVEFGCKSLTLGQVLLTTMGVGVWWQVL